MPNLRPQQANACEAADDVVSAGERTLQQHFSTLSTGTAAHSGTARAASSGATNERHDEAALGRTTRRRMSGLSLRQRAQYFGVRSS